MNLLRKIRFPLNSLRVQLILWIALPVAISLLALSMMEIRGHEQAMTHLVQQQVDLVARSLRMLIHGEVKERQALLQEWASGVAGGLPVPESATDFFSAGVVVMPSNDPPAWAALPSVVALAETRRQGAADDAGNVDVETVYDESAGVWLLVTAISLRMDDGIVVLVGAETVTAILATDSVAMLDPAQVDEVQLFSSTGDQIFHRAVTDHSPTDARHVAHGAERWVVAQELVAATGWNVIVRKDWRDLVPPLLNFGNVALFIVAVAVVLSVLVAYLGLRTIVWPLQRLNFEVSRVGLGEFLSIQQPIGGVAEIEDLRDVLARMTEQIRQYQTKLQSYIGAMTLGQEEERRRLARELHDETVQNLIALNQQVEMLERDLARGSDAASARVQKLRPLVTATIDDLRRQIYALRPLYLEDLGFVPALEMLVQEVCQRDGLTYQFTAQLAGDGQSLKVIDTVIDTVVDGTIDEPVQISLYRIAQEALQNVAKHADASHVDVSLHMEERAILLRVADNGKGFVVPHRSYHLAQEGHFGLLGMTERAQLHGGTLRLESQPGRGTMIEVRIPRHKESQS